MISYICFLSIQIILKCYFNIIFFSFWKPKLNPPAPANKSITLYPIYNPSRNSLISLLPLKLVVTYYASSKIFSKRSYISISSEFISYPLLEAIFKISTACFACLCDGTRSCPASFPREKAMLRWYGSKLQVSLAQLEISNHTVEGTFWICSIQQAFFARCSTKILC